MAKWPEPRHVAPRHRDLAKVYVALRQACAAFNDFQDNNSCSEQELKQLDLAQVCLRLGYKRVKKVLTRAGAECGRRKLGAI